MSTVEQPSTEENEPFLSFNTAPRAARHVKINGEIHIMRDPAFMPLVDACFLDQAVPRIGVLLRQAAAKDSTLTDEERAEADELLDEVLELALDAPEEVRNRIPTGMKIILMHTFMTRETAEPGPVEPSLRRKRRTNKGATNG